MRVILGLTLAVGACGGSATEPPTPPPAVSDEESGGGAAPEPSEQPAGAEPVALEVPGGGPDPMTLDASYSSSIGTPVEGRIEGGVPLPLHGPGFRFNPAKRPERRHGTVELVQALVRASAVVHEELPGNPVTISDISMPDGGDIVGHASHRSGRDVDVYFYLLTADEQPFPAKAIPLEPDGTGHEYGDLAIAEDDVEVRLDVPRTWKFMEALVSDPDARINHILVAEHIRTLLLKHAEKIGAPEAARTRFGHLTCQPRFPHDDHVHIRFFCSADDIEAGCEDTRPIYPWHQAHLDDAGVQVRIAGKRKSAGPKLTSVKAARKKAAAGIEMHQDVIAFLDRRETWAKKPRSGRKYCR